MKILTVPAFYQSHTFSSKNTTAPLSFKPQLNRDTVSFGYLNEKPDQSMQIYRSVSQKELDVLLSGQDVLNSGYVTSDPKGWRSYNWHSGYVHDNREPVYFVTFKKNKLRIFNRRDDEKDTRYGILGKYSLNDVENIREGTNAHGKIIYAADFEKAQTEDINNKKSEIDRLKKIIIYSGNHNEKESAWDELSSYAQEFPDIVNIMEKVVDYKNESDVSGIATLISYADDKENLPLMRKCFESQIKNYLRVANSQVDFYAKYAQNSDMPLVLEMIEKKKLDVYSAGLVLAKVSEEKDYEHLKELLKKGKISDLHILADCYSRKNDDGKYTDLFRNILADDIKIPIDEFDKYKYGSSEHYVSGLVEICAKQLAQHGSKEDISILEKYVSKTKPSHYPSYEVNNSIEKLMEKST